MNPATIKPHSIENDEKSRISVVEAHKTGSGKENKGREVDEHSFAKDETYKKRITTIKVQTGKEEPEKVKGGQPDEKRLQKVSNDTEQQVAQPEVRTGKSSFWGGKFTETTEKKEWGNGKKSGKETTVSKDKRTVAGSTEKTVVKVNREQNDDTCKSHKESETTAVSFTGSRRHEKTVIDHTKKGKGFQREENTEINKTSLFGSTDTLTMKSVSDKTGKKFTKHDEKDRNFTSFTGAKKHETTVSDFTKTGKATQKEENTTIDKTSAFGNTESTRIKNISTKKGKTETKSLEKETTKHSKFLGKESQSTSIFKSEKKTTGNKTTKDKEHDNISHSFWRGTETSHSETHSTTTKTDAETVTKKISDLETKSKLEGNTIKHKESTKTMQKNGKYVKKEKAHTLNKRALMTTYSSEKTTTKPLVGKLKTSHKKSLEIKSSLPFIQRMLENKMKKETGKSFDASADKGKKTQPPPKPESKPATASSGPGE